jgi:predicted nucleic acid-binding protein
LQNLRLVSRTIRPGFAERILPVTASTADRSGRLNAIHLTSVIDCLMGATALVNDLTLVTRNIQAVERTGAKLLSPFGLS